VPIENIFNNGDMQKGKNDIHHHRRKLECAKRTLSRESFAEEDKEVIRSLPLILYKLDISYLFILK
jgi:hypothetical protein